MIGTCCLTFHTDLFHECKSGRTNYTGNMMHESESECDSNSTFGDLRDDQGRTVFQIDMQHLLPDANVSTRCTGNRRQAVSYLAVGLYFSKASKADI